MRIYKPKEFSKLVGVTVHTLQEWDRSGKLKAQRTISNRRYYTEEDLQKALNKNTTSKDERYSVGYARVSTKSQQNNLENQIRFISEYTNATGVILENIYSDVASGLNYNRNSWNKILSEVQQNKIDKIYITYKDRFTRFGFEWFENFCKQFDTEIIVLNQKQTSPEEELIEDMLSIMHVFSARSYGMRRYKNNLMNELKQKDKEE